MHMFFLVPIAGLVIGGNPADSRLPVWLAIPVIAIATYICYAITTHRLAFLPKSKWFIGCRRRMDRRIYAATAIALLICSIPLSCNRSVIGSETREAIKTLDRTLADAPIYEEARQRSIDSLKAQLATTDASHLPSCYGKLHDIYYSFKSDSAMHYTALEYQAAVSCGNEKHRVNSLLNIAQLNNIIGNYTDTKTILDGLNRDSLSSAHLSRMYSVYNILHEYSSIISLDPMQAAYHRAKAMEYKDSLLAMGENIFVHTHKLMVEGEMDEALEIIKKYCDSLPIDHPKKSMATFLVSIIYREKGGDYDNEEITYLVRSVTSDIITARKDHTAMIQLANILFEKGDQKRAYRYINKALEDATMCKVNLKMESTSQLMPIISDAYEHMVRRNYLLFSLVLAVICLISFLLIQSLISQKKQKKELAVINRQLGEASNIKNTYITRLILECNRRIERLDQYRKELNCKAKNADMDVLLRELRSQSFSEKEWQSFYEVFDSTFLSIFPSFVGEFNKLMTEDNAIVPRQQGSLTPELRIYALIRLGIDSSEKIASLLRYSKTTIYTYRSKTRKKALNPEIFEENVKNIESI